MGRDYIEPDVVTQMNRKEKWFNMGFRYPTLWGQNRFREKEGINRIEEDDFKMKLLINKLHRMGFSKIEIVKRIGWKRGRKLKHKISVDAGGKKIIKRRKNGSTHTGR